ncbi:MAG: ATP-binding protein [Actinocatenispora sp.]
MSAPQVHLLCGYPGAGKTTYARRLARQLPAVRFSLDEWMLRLYPLRFDDPHYAAHAENCKNLMWDVAEQVLGLGRDVVLDWCQWNRQRRTAWRLRAEEAGYRPVLHHVVVPVETAIRRVEARTARGTPGSHPIDADGVRQFHTIFEPPTPDEGIEIVEVSG